MDGAPRHGMSEKTSQLRRFREAVEFLERTVAAGAMVEGAAEESLAELRVVA